eukprot:3164477-Rhodomonas_salina.1
MAQVKLLLASIIFECANHDPSALGSHDCNDASPSNYHCECIFQCKLSSHDASPINYLHCECFFECANHDPSALSINNACSHNCPSDHATPDYISCIHYHHDSFPILCYGPRWIPFSEPQLRPRFG